MKKPYYKYLNAFFTSLAVGTLFADSAFELFPVVCIFFYLNISFDFLRKRKNNRLLNMI
jgi:hypothetical protein